MTRVAVVGHSFGGGTSVCALAKDPRFKDSGAEEDTSNVGICFKLTAVSN